MVQEHIHKLLFTHDCVIIPDFGGLITHYESAHLHPVKHSFTPPSKRVAFNEKLKINDGLLISTFAYDTRITNEEAQKQVAAFVRNLQEELQTKLRFELKGIGIFRRNAAQKLEFDYIPGENFLNDSFGLPEILARPVGIPDASAGLRTLLKDKQKEDAISTAKPTLRRKLKRLYNSAAVVAIISLSASALYFLSLQTDYNLSSLNPVAVFITDAEQINKTEQITPQNTVAENTKLEKPKLSSDPITEETNFNEEASASVNIPAEETSSTLIISSKTASVPLDLKKETEAKLLEKPVAKLNTIKPTKIITKPVAAGKETVAIINSETGRFYVIAGGYATLGNAKYLQTILKKGGQEGSKVILPYTGSELHRVSITDFTWREEAIQALPALKNKYGKNIWILNY